MHRDPTLRARNALVIPGVLLILLILPSGLGGLVYRLRDRWLARVASKHHISAPGLAAATPVA